jgi:pimeloyl-ACP methyl ester carboxylesterase
MRMVWTALLCGTLSLSGRVPAAAGSPPLPGTSPTGVSPTTGISPLQECRLEHPLRIAAVAARCGILNVPEDPAHPGGGAIDLRVAVVPALNRRAAAAPLFLLAGGPGQAATDLYASFAAAFARVNRNHDIVLVDQRGTGRSAPLTCAYPDDWQSAPDEMLRLRQATLTCLGKFGPRVRFYTTSIAVADLDRVRAALGYERIDLYGSSYGTRVAELYMRRYPGRAHAVVLDGVTYPEQAIGPDTPSDGERALYLIVARCEGAPDCAAANGTRPTTRKSTILLRRPRPRRAGCPAVCSSSGSSLVRAMTFSCRSGANGRGPIGDGYPVLALHPGEVDAI